MTGRSAGSCISASLGLVALLFLFSGTARAQDQTCADFSSQEDAQAFYNDHQDDDPNNPDPFELDTDNDGTACEGLPTAQNAAQASPSPTPAASPGSGSLPQNGAETGVIALSGLSLLEAGYGLTLASKRLGIRRRSIPLYLMRRMINAAETGGDRIEIANDVYLVHASALARRDDDADVGDATDHDLFAQAPRLDDVTDRSDDDRAFDEDFIEIELSEEDPADLSVDEEIAVEPQRAAPARRAPNVYAALARPDALPYRER